MGEAGKKQDTKIKFSHKVENAIKAYNDIVHSAINCNPNEALAFENITEVKKRQFFNRIEKYKRFFNTKV